MLDHWGRRQTCFHTLLQLFGYICEKMPLKCSLLPTFLPCSPSPWICGPSLMLAPALCYSCAAGTGDGLADQSSQLMAGIQGAVQFPGVRLYTEVLLQHGTTLQANRAPDSPCLQQVHIALVNQQIPYAAHIMREGR